VVFCVFFVVSVLVGATFPFCLWSSFDSGYRGCHFSVRCVVIPFDNDKMLEPKKTSLLGESDL